jgi:hypothetical protein
VYFGDNLGKEFKDNYEDILGANFGENFVKNWLGEYNVVDDIGVYIHTYVFVQTS